MASDDDVTDSFPLPARGAAAAGIAVRVSHGGSTREGALLGVHGDEIVVRVAQPVPVDAQVEVRHATGALESVGLVIWARSDDDAGQTSLGIEIIGGAGDWTALLGAD